MRDFFNAVLIVKGQLKMEIPQRSESRHLGTENGCGKLLLWRVIGIALTLELGSLAFSHDAPRAVGVPVTMVVSNGDDRHPRAATPTTRTGEFVAKSGSRNQPVESNALARWRDHGVASGNQPTGSLSYFALLVGCTDYQSSGLPDLWGPANDIPAWAKVLVNRFGFPAANVISLVGWPEDARKRPTYANITRAVDEIHARSKSGDQVVIVLSGHGTQVPSPKTPKISSPVEVDGFDEVFLPADVRSWTLEGIENGILDDEIGRWLERFQHKGVHVWVVFDCCHAAGLAKPQAAGTEGAPVGRRVVGFKELGIPDQVVKDAVRRAEETAAKAKADGRPIAIEGKSGWLDRVFDDADAATSGSIVAFYACQGLEETPELPRPPDSPQAKENYYGLFSYNLITVLSQGGSGLTYRELSRKVASRYELERPGLPPTTVADGPLDRRLLGLNSWPKRPSMTLSRSETGSLTIDAGELLGLTGDSILAVILKRGRPAAASDTLGYLRIKVLGPTHSTVEPTDYGPLRRVDAKSLPRKATCELVTQRASEPE